MKTLLLSTLLFFIGCSPQSEESKFDGNKIKIGEYEIFILNERKGEGSIDILIEPEDSVIKEFAPDSTFKNAVNAFLVKKGNDVWIVDTGFGRNIFRIMDSLKISPANVGQILLTHMHGDHIGGMLKDSTIQFPNAEVILSKKEYTFWSGEGERMQNTRKILKTHGEKVQPTDPLPLTDNYQDGINMIEAYGHTPGHVMFLIKDGKEQLLIWGDLIHAESVQMPHPEIAVRYDIDPEAARNTRLKVFQFLEENPIPVAGMHLYDGFLLP